MNEKEKVQAFMEHQKELIAKVEASMSNVPEKYRTNQLLTLEQLKSELTIWEARLSEQKL